MDRWGIMSPALMPIMVARNLFISMYPRMVEIVQLLGSSSLMALPTEGFRQPDRSGPRTLSGDRHPDGPRAREAIPSGVGVACSAFGGRQALYERFFQGDILRNAVVTTNIYAAQPLMERVRRFLEQE